MVNHSVIAPVPMYLLSKFTKEKVRVSLSGDGLMNCFVGIVDISILTLLGKFKIFNLKNKSIYTLLNKIP